MFMSTVKDAYQVWIVILAIICAAISAIYYFRVIQAIYFKEPPIEIYPALDLTKSFKYLLIISAAILIIAGILPSLVVDWLYF